MSDELRRSRIVQARTENLMILYTDSFRGGNSQTAFYDPLQGVLGRRDFYPQTFLRAPRHRRLLLETFTQRVRGLASQSRWQALNWLHSRFPSAHIPSAPDDPLHELQGIIQREASRVRVGHHNGWDEVREVPEAMRLQRAEQAQSTRNAARATREATETLRRGLRHASGEDAHHNCFSSSGVRTLGGHTNMGPANWANGLRRYIVTINELRRGRTTSRSGPLPGAPVTLTASMVGNASHAWNRDLNDEQRDALRNDSNWGQAMGEIWQELLARLAWGLERVGIAFDPEVFEEGRWRYPDQGCY